MAQREVEGLLFEVISPTEYSLLGFEDITLEIKFIKNQWVVFIIQPLEDQWESNIQGGFDTLIEAVRSIQMMVV